MAPPPVPFTGLSWCSSLSECLPGRGPTAATELMRGRFCEEMLESPPCPEQWFGYLAVEDTTWQVRFPHCDTFLPTSRGPVRNTFSILASTDVVAVTSADDAPVQHVGAVILQFVNTSTTEAGWASMAESKSCSLHCLRRTAGVVHVSTLLVGCPAPGARVASPLADCAHVEASMLLARAGERVTSTDSRREGELCDWSQAPDVPNDDARWERLSGVVMGALYLAYRAYRPVGLARALHVKFT